MYNTFADFVVSNGKLQHPFVGIPDAFNSMKKKNYLNQKLFVAIFFFKLWRELTSAET